VQATVDGAKRAKTEWPADGQLCLQIESQLVPKDSHPVDFRVESIVDSIPSSHSGCRWPFVRHFHETVQMPYPTDIWLDGHAHKVHTPSR